MKKLIFITAILFVGMALKAQESFFPTKEGTVLVYKSFDKKDKLTGSVRYTIMHVNINGKNIDFTYLCESADQKEKPLFKEEVTIHQKGDKLYFDMGNFINKAAFQQNGVMPAEVEIKGGTMEFPLDPKPGDVLPNANIEMSVTMAFINMKMSTDITNRKVGAIEDITVKGGTFKCYKLSCDVNSVAMGMKTSGKNIEWYSKGIGTVKSESYDKSGKLQSRIELMEVSK